MPRATETGEDWVAPILSKVQDILANIAPDWDDEIIDPSMTLHDDLSLGGIELMELGLRLEDEFDINVPDDDLEGFDTVMDMVKYIGELLRETRRENLQ